MGLALPYDDRFRGIKGTRDVLLMNRLDIDRLGLADGAMVRVETVAEDGVRRALPSLRIVDCDLPTGCVGAYYPEANVLLPLWHVAIGSLTPAAKPIPLRVHRMSGDTARTRHGRPQGTLQP